MNRSGYTIVQAGAEVPAEEPRGAWERFMEFRESLPEAEPWLVNLTKEQMRDMIASRYA